MRGSLTARRCAAGVVAGAIGFAALSGITGLFEPSSRARSVVAAGAVPVQIRLPSTSRGDLLAGNAVPVGLRPSNGGRVRVVARLRRPYAHATELGHTAVTLAASRWRRVSIPLSSAGRRALSPCPSGDVVVSVVDSRFASARSSSRRLHLDAPGCARFFAHDTFWNSTLPADAPLDPNSAGVTKELLRQVSKGMKSGPHPTINTSVSAPPVYTVSGSQHVVAVHLDQPPGYAPSLAAAFAAVPLPDYARPSAGSDSELVVWQPATDTLWEFWLLRHQLDGWHAKWGGRLSHVSTGPGLYGGPQASWGESASGLPLPGGMITPRELRRGQIKHVLGLGIPRARAKVYARPALRTDGASNCLHAVPEGARFRLDPRLDIDALQLPRPVAAMARAAQRYGIVVRDQSGAVAFYAQNVVSLQGDPYPSLFGGKTPQELVARFPWSHLQLVRMDLAREKGGAELPPPGSLVNGCS